MADETSVVPEETTTSEETTDTVVISYDYTPQLNTIISNQQQQIELLEQQNAYLAEQVNGLSLTVNYLNSFYAIFIGVIAVSLLWNVLNKWFFRGV